MEGEEARRPLSPPMAQGHLGIDAATLEIRAVGVTDNSIGDAPMLPKLLGQILLEEHIISVSGDGAYDTKRCLQAIALRQADAVIPSRKNAKPWKKNRLGAGVLNEILRATRRLGRTIWKKWSGYYQRSLVETKCAASSCLVNASWRATLVPGR
jgi:hypothetical protein